MTAQTDIFSEQVDRQTLARQAAERAAEARQVELGIDSLAEIVLSMQNALEVLCPECRELFDARVADTPLWPSPIPRRTDP